MNIRFSNFEIFAIAVVSIAVGTVIFAISYLSKPNGREPKEIDSSGYYRIIKIEGREYIVSNKNLTPLHSCSCKCDSVK
jgi:hypothetical protein